MYICLCKSLTDRDIHQGVYQGEVACMQSLRERLGAATGCGSCEMAARQCLDEALARKRRFGNNQLSGAERDAGAGDTTAWPDIGDASAA